MIVICESCSTKFRLDETRIKQPRVRVRCSHCGHVFTVMKDPVANDEVIAGFDLPHDAEGLDSVPYSSPYLGAGKGSGGRLRRLIKPLILATVLLLVLGGLIGGGYYYLHHRPTFSLSQRNDSAPPAGGDESLSAVKIRSEVKSFFLTNAHAGLIFVISGEVTNDSTQPVSFVLVEGQLHDGNNQAVRKQRCYCGNPISKEDLEHLDMTDIQNRMMNREGLKLTNVQIAPKAQVPFMVVFHNLPSLDSLTDYSVKVVSADFAKGN